MKYPIARFVLISLAFALAYTSADAQDRTLSAAAGDRYVISAKAGGVNFVEGSVTISRKVGKSGLLIKGDNIGIGDRVTTATDGKVEILLNPGSYLRLGGNSTFQFKTTSLDDLQLDLDSGSAVLEVFAADEFKVEVTTPDAKYILIETGVFRVDAGSDLHSQLRVWKGQARVGTSYAVKPGRSASTGAAGDISVAKFDRDEKDALDTWSKIRSKELSKLGTRLARNDLRTSLMRSFLGRRWNMFNSFGLWVYDPLFGGHCFLPFGNGWSSPYGYGFNNSIWWYDLPPVVYMPPQGVPTPPRRSGVAGVGPIQAPQPPAASVGTIGDPTPTPPFVKMQQTMGGGRPGALGNNSYDPSSSSPSYTPTFSSSSTSSASSSSSSSSSSPSSSSPSLPTTSPKVKP